MLEKQKRSRREHMASGLTAWEKREIIRHKNRPTVKDYIPAIFKDFYELHGDRFCGDDHAIYGGIGSFKGIPVTVIAQVKGRNLEENKDTNFAMPHPEGYRKALRLAQQAEKFHRPVIFLIDTPGAFCGIAAEQRGQGEAIARNLLMLSTLKTPIISIVLGEGGSGGALALGVCDELAMLENALYSVVAPRSFANILWKDPSREKEAAQAMKMTAEDLIALGIAEEMIPEPAGGAHNNVELMIEYISDYIEKTLGKLCTQPIEKLLESRYHKFRKIGEFAE